MNKKWVLSQESFDALLAWLDSDRERAGAKYEEIRRRLIKIFAGRGCLEAEDLADETINRVTSKLNEIGKEFTGDCERYFYGVANKVYMEYQRRKQPQPPPATAEDSNRVEQECDCLEECIAQLSSEDRELLLQYYHAEGRAKIDERKHLAEKLGIAPNALRIRAFRIRTALQECVENCLERKLG
jgi:DNA-directed RNA polymerase specialized sigma24 family protein